MTFFRPFFFLLVDSWEESALGAVCCCEPVVEVAGAAPSAALLSDELPDTPVELLAGCVSAGGVVDGGSVFAAGCASGADDDGAEIISAPTPVVGNDSWPVCASIGTTGSEDAPSLSPTGTADKLKLGPAAPCFKTSVAEMTLSGGVRFGAPTRAA